MTARVDDRPPRRGGVGPRMLALAGGVAAAAALGTTSCNALWGVDELRFAERGGDAAGGSGGPTTTKSGGGGSGTTGGGGASPVSCDPGSKADCYTGPPDTENMGLCRAGAWQCNDTGTGYGACEDQVLPSVEICGNAEDEDCDGSAPSDCLVSDSLVARYYMDEDSSGQGPLALLDAAASPLPLVLQYSSSLAYCERDNGRGLCWSAADEAGGASAAVATGSKVWAAFDGKSQATLEAVVAVDDAYFDGSNVVRIGPPASYSSELRLAVGPGGMVECSVEAGSNCGTWSVGNTTVRTVLHLVYDTTQATPVDRTRLYRDGAIQAHQSEPQFPTLNATFDLTSANLDIGNRYGGSTSLRGAILYVALYSRAFDATEVASNASQLLVTDDSPSRSVRAPWRERVRAWLTGTRLGLSGARGRQSPRQQTM